MHQPNYADMIPPVYAEAMDGIRMDIMLELHKDRCFGLQEAVIAALDGMLRDILTRYYQEDWDSTFERCKERYRAVRDYKDRYLKERREDARSG